MSFVRGSNPVWLYDDLVGNLFDDTYYMFVLQNDLPYLPATVYHDPQGNTPWTNPIRFFANGTLPIDIFFDTGSPEEPAVYRLEFRQGDTQSDPLIYLVENYLPGGGGSGPITTVGFISDNQITNPQFALINFKSPYSISGTNPGAIPFAPGWFLLLTGTGTATLEQIPLNDDPSTLNPTNAPYALHLTLVGWDSATLIQIFDQNGMLWASQTTTKKYVSSSITARIEGAPQNISATLVDSNGTVLTTVLNSVPVNSVFNEYIDFGEMPLTTNPDIPPDAAISYELHLPEPSNVDIYLTSIQVAVQNLPTSTNYQQDSIDRQIDYTFHYYNNPLQDKEVPSLLTGWDFPLNPAQLGSTKTVTTTPAYAWDQTIMASAVNNINVTRHGHGALQTQTTVDNDAFYVLQYLDGPEALKTAATEMSVNVFAYCSTHPGVVVRVYLFNGLAAIPTLPTTIGTIDNTGVFTLTAGSWSSIVQPLSYSKSETLGFNILNDYKFNLFAEGLPNFNLGANNFAIVVTFMVPTSGTLTILESISCTPGSIATRPAPQTYDQVLRECQYYYEQSYALGNASNPAGTTTALNQKLILMDSVSETGTGAANSYASPFMLEYSLKRTTPTVTIYSTSGMANNVAASLNYALVTTNAFTTAGPTNQPVATFWNTTTSTRSSSFVPKVITALNNVVNSSLSNTYSSASITYHYVANAQLGIV